VVQSLANGVRLGSLQPDNKTKIVNDSHNSHDSHDSHKNDMVESINK